MCRMSASQFNLSVAKVEVVICTGICVKLKRPSSAIGKSLSFRIVEKSGARTEYDQKRTSNYIFFRM